MGSSRRASPFFAPLDPASSRLAIASPNKIYEAGIGPGSESNRLYCTVKPLTELMQLEIDAASPDDDIEGLAAVVAQSSCVTRVSWERKVIHDFVRALTPGAINAPPRPDERFDMVFVIDRNGTGWTFTQVSQPLLAGDRSGPFQ
jgi:hypothetical protein